MDNFPIGGVDVPLLEPPHSKENDVPRRILYVLFKYKWFIATVFLTISLPAFVVYMLTPKRYFASAKVMIRPSRAYLNVSPTSDEGTLRISPSPDRLNSEIQIIKSREVLERLVKEVPFPEDSGDPWQADNSEGAINMKAVAMGARLNVSPVRLSNLIQIGISSTDRRWAIQVVNRAAELYLEQHLKVHKTQGIEEFYDEQQKKLQNEYAEAVAVLKEFQEKEHVVDTEKELASTMGMLASLEANLRTTESTARESSEKLRILEAQLKEQRENVATGRTASTNPVVSRMRDRLVQLEIERNTLLQRYTSKDRLVMDKETEIAELKSSLKKEEDKIMGGQSVSLNSIHDGILHGVLSERAGANALEAKRGTLVKQIGSLSAAASELKRKSYTYDRLLQQVNSKKEALAIYNKKAEEARISDAMDERKFSSASIFEKASPPLPAAGFKPSLIILAILLVSIGIAIGGAFGMDYFSTTLRNEADIEEQIGLPVLATIQYYGS